MKNGDVYKAIPALQNARGYRWQYAYIDKEIDNEMLHTVILPKYIPERDGNDKEIFKDFKDVCEYY